jgi:hypothetical protein
MQPAQRVLCQERKFGLIMFKKHSDYYRIAATVRYDDRHANGHNTFSITGQIDRQLPTGRWINEECGCIHAAIAQHFPKLAPLIKWHLVSTDGPLHYIANTCYHVLEHGPKYAWIYYCGLQDPLQFKETNTEELLGYITAEQAKRALEVPGYRVVWDEKTCKVRNLDAARASAIWPDATDEELTAPGLPERLHARLPKLLEEFRQAVESLGLVY